jgi:transposase InsO family protein
MMDVFGRFAVGTVEPTNTAYRAFRSLLTAVVAIVGPPDEILTDRGPAYIAEIFDHFRDYFSFEKKFTYAHRHQSNPAERGGQ